MPPIYRHLKKTWPENFLEDLFRYTHHPHPEVDVNKIPAMLDVLADNHSEQYRDVIYAWYRDKISQPKIAKSEGVGLAVIQGRREKALRICRRRYLEMIYAD